MTTGRFRQQIAGEEAAEDDAAAGVPRDFGREAAMARAQAQSPALRRIRRDLDCEPPWDIGEVHLSGDQGHRDRFDVWVFDQAGYWPCPSCSRQLAGRDHTPTQVYRCLTCDTETYVYVRIPIVECPAHGSQRVDVPWAGHQGKWSYSRTIPQAELQAELEAEIQAEIDPPADTGAGGR